MKALLLVVYVLVSTQVFAQPPARIISPEVQPDGHVTFRLRAPNAAKVEVSVEGQGPGTPMQKDEQGIWSATVGPLQPDTYGYSLIVDGVGLIDPSNQLMKPNLLNTQ